MWQTKATGGVAIERETNMAGCMHGRASRSCKMLTHPPKKNYTHIGSTGGPRLALLYLGIYLASEPLALPQTHPLLAAYMSKALTLVLGLWALCLSWDMLQLFLLRSWRGDVEHSADPTLVSALGFARCTMSRKNGDICVRV